MKKAMLAIFCAINLTGCGSLELIEAYTRLDCAGFAGVKVTYTDQLNASFECEESAASEERQNAE